MQYVDKFRRAVDDHKKDIIEKSLIKEDHPVEAILPEIKELERSYDINSINNQINKLKLDINGDNQNSNQVEVNSDENDICNSFESNKIEPTSNALDSVTNINYVTNTDKSYLDNDKETNGDSKTTSDPIDKETKSEVNDKLSNCNLTDENKLLEEIFPFGHDMIKIKNGQICLDSIEKNKRTLLLDLRKSLTEEEIKKLNCFSMKDVDIDSPNYVNEKIMNVGFDKKENYVARINSWTNLKECKPYYLDGKGLGNEFDFDYQPDLEGHPGPSPSVILQVCILKSLWIPL